LLPWFGQQGRKRLPVEVVGSKLSPLLEIQLGI
jgi:hypothetical protein